MAYSFKKSIKVQSDLCPGVTFVIRKITESRRSEMRLKLADLQDKLSDMSAEIKLLDPVKDEKALRRAGVNIDEFVLREIEVYKIRWATIRVEGLVLEGEDGEEIPGTLDNALAWSSELRAELLAIIDDGSVMMESEAKNYGASTTYGAVVARQIRNTTVLSAESPSTTSTGIETAPATSLAE
jgi:hypothetical protein